MFHTKKAEQVPDFLANAVVIPWRGFRCFTPFNRRESDTSVISNAVVIPWRGFRCFTRNRAGRDRRFLRGRL